MVLVGRQNRGTFVRSSSHATHKTSPKDFWVTEVRQGCLERLSNAEAVRMYVRFSPRACCRISGKEPSQQSPHW